MTSYSKKTISTTVRTQVMSMQNKVTKLIKSGWTCYSLHI